MYNPESMYRMARLEHEVRIASARRAVEAREARRESGYSWFAAVTSRLRPARSSRKALVFDIADRVGRVETASAMRRADEVAAA